MWSAGPRSRRGFQVAKARKLGIPLLSADNKILSYGHVRSIW
jgi:hypothetical protein